MYDLIGENGLDLETPAARLRRMGDTDLLHLGRAAHYMSSPEANLGKEPRSVLLIQLRKAGGTAAASPDSLR